LAGTLFAVTGCKKRGDVVPPSVEKVDFLVETSSVPIWLEGQELKQIPNPASVSISNFEPWSYMPHVTGMTMINGDLAIIINKFGIYYVRNSEAENEHELLAFRKIEGSGDFLEWTASAPFVFNEKTSVFLSKIDYFTENETKRLENRVFSLFLEDDALQSVEIPPFYAFPSQGYAEIKDFFLDMNGEVFFSVKNGFPPKISYYKSDSLLLAGTEIPIDEYRIAGAGNSFDSAPSVLQAVLPPLQTEKTLNVKVFSDIAGGYWTLSRGDGEEIEEFSACFTEKGMPFAAVLSTDGLLRVTKIRDKNSLYVEEKRLPSLPDGFFYSQLGFCGKALVAAWEERNNWNIGSFGILIIEY
jgi:hypothetical protein